MPATITTLEREIALEERRVGIPVNQPLTDKAIARRRMQIAAVLGASGFVALFAVIMASGIVSAGAMSYNVTPGIQELQEGIETGQSALFNPLAPIADAAESIRFRTRRIEDGGQLLAQRVGLPERWTIRQERIQAHLLGSVHVR